jgi:hypothetical protein
MAVTASSAKAKTRAMRAAKDELTIVCSLKKPNRGVKLCAESGSAEISAFSRRSDVNWITFR